MEQELLSEESKKEFRNYLIEHPSYVNHIIDRYLNDMHTEKSIIFVELILKQLQEKLNNSNFKF